MTEDGKCKHCNGEGCKACDAREVLHINKQQTPEEYEIHKFRQEIDVNIKRVEYFMGISNGDDSHASNIRRDAGRELALVRTKLQEAKMWAGKCLEAIDSPFPEELRDEAK